MHKMLTMLYKLLLLSSVTAWTLTDLTNDYIGEEIVIWPNTTSHDVCLYMSFGYELDLKLTNGSHVVTHLYHDEANNKSAILARTIDGVNIPGGDYDIGDASDQLDPNFDPERCNSMSEQQLVDWYFRGGDKPVNLLDYYTVGPNDDGSNSTKRDAVSGYCLSPGQSCVTNGGAIDPTLCETHFSSKGTACCCAVYSPYVAACQTSYQKSGYWLTDGHANWGAITRLVLWFVGNAGYGSRR